MDEKRLLELCQELTTLAKNAGADDAEAAASWHREAQTHLENGDLHTVQSSEELMFGLRVLVGGAQGFVTTNDTSAAELRAAAEEAVAQARVMPPDEHNGLPDPEACDPIDGLYDEAAAAAGTTETTAFAADLMDRIRETDERVKVDSGAVNAGESRIALASSRGVALTERSTSVDGFFFGMAVDGEEIASFDYDGETSRTLQGFRDTCEAAADRFVAKCLAGLGAGAGRSYRGSVVLAPEAVAEFLLPTVAGALCSDNIRKQRSKLAGRLGEKTAHESFTLIDDGRRPGGSASSAFDREGLPVRRLELIREGVVSSYLVNTYEARASDSGLQSTGHATGSITTLPSVGPHCLELAAGDIPEADLLDAEEEILLVNRFSGSTNGVTGDFSGVVKNGFLCRGGEKRPVKEVMIQGNIFEMLHEISGISKERRCLNGSVIVPTLRVDGISVTAG